MHVVPQMITGTPEDLLHMLVIGQILNRYLRVSHDIMAVNVRHAGILTIILFLIALFPLKIQNTWSFCDE